MFGFLRRRDPEPEPVKAKGGPVWFLDELVAARPAVEHVVTPTGQPGVYVHSWRAAPQTEAQRQAAEDAAIAQYDAVLDLTRQRFRVATPRPSVFDTPPDPERFPH